MTSLSLFSDAEDLARWLLGAACEYGKTLRVDPDTGATYDLPTIGSAQLREARGRALSPLLYDEEFSFVDHVFRGAGRCEAIALSSDDQHAHLAVRATVENGTVKALRRWERRDGPHALYLLVSVAARANGETALPVVRDLLTKGKASTLRSDWKRAIGYQIAVLGNALAPSPDAQELLEDIATRHEFWSVACSGLALSGITQGNPKNWLRTANRFIDDLEKLNPVALSAQLYGLVNAASLRNILVTTCAQLPVFYGFDEIQRPLKSEPTVRIFNRLFTYERAPIEYHFYGRQSFSCGEAQMALRIATDHDDVQRAFERVARQQNKTLLDDGYIYHACEERFAVLTGRSINLPDPGVHVFASALSDFPVNDETPEDMRETEAYEDVFANVDSALDSLGQPTLDAAFASLERSFSPLGEGRLQ